MKRLILIATLALAGAMFSNAENPADPSSRQASAQHKQQSTSVADEGEKRFQTHCGRCHQPPEDLSPRTARAVVRHMRVRAMLTHEDEQLILQFIAPH